MGRNRILGSPFQVEQQTSDFTTRAVTDLYLVTAALGSPVTVTLDPNAFEGDQVTIHDEGNNASDQAIIVQASAGQTILNGWGSTLTISSDGADVILTFHLALGGWVPAFTAGNSSGTGCSGVVPNPSWFISDWFINWDTGSDDNPGTTELPVKTIQGGVVAKWCTIRPTLPQTTILHSQVPQPLGAENIVVAPVMVGGSNFVIVVTPQPVGTSFPAGAVTPKVRSASGNDLMVAGFTGAGLAVGQLVENLTKNSTGTIDAIASGTATMCQPFANAGLTTVSATPVWVEDDTWAPDDTLQAASQGLLNLKVFAPTGGDSNSATTAPVGWIQGAYLPDVSGVPGNSTFAAMPIGMGIVFSNCRFDVFLQLNGSNQDYVAATINCFCNGGGFFAQSAIVGGSSNTSGNEFTLFEAGVMDGDAILHAITYVKGVYCIAGFVHIGASAAGAREVALAHGAYLIIEPYALGGAHVWGTAGATLDTEGACTVELGPVVGQTWSTCLTLTTLAIEADSAASRILSGVIIDGQYALTSANLDAFNGMQNVEKGARFISNNAPTAPAPTATPGTGVTSAEVFGNDVVGTLQFTMSGSPAAGVIVTVTFGVARATPPASVQLTPNTSTAGLDFAAGFYVTTSDTGFVVSAGAAPTAGATLAFLYSVTG